jgi:hypothetical protein
MTISGDGTIGGLVAGGLPNATVVATDLASGAARANFGAGTVLQVVPVNVTPAFSTTSNTFTNTGISASITPSSATSKIFIASTFLPNTQSGNMTMSTTVFRDSTQLAIDAAQYTASGGWLVTTCTINFVDSPNTTSAVTYNIRARVSAGAGTISILNPASIVLMEIAA